MKIIGHHRSRALAERHLRALGEGWRISARRNASGQYSNRGHTFTFEKSEEIIFEWLVTFTYEATGKSVDVICTAKTEPEAIETALAFIRQINPKLYKIISEYQWSIRAARGPISALREPQFRSKS